MLFCLAADLGSKATGEWEKAEWVSGWAAMPGKYVNLATLTHLVLQSVTNLFTLTNCRLSIDSIGGMKNRLPAIRKQLNSDPAYFKKVYMHTFDLAKAVGARTLALDSGTSCLSTVLTTSY